MERSLAGSSPLTRSPRLRPRGSGRGRGSARGSSVRGPIRLRHRPRLPAPLAAAAASVGTAARRVRALLARVWRRRAGRIALVAVVVAVPLLGGGYVWLRNSSLVAVRHVRISGLHGPEAAAIESALVGAAHGMTTLHVRTGVLRAAVAAFPVVREVHASASFPHGLHITVVEQPPVAALVAGGARTAVAADGVALGPALLSGSLPTVPALVVPRTGQHVAGAIQRSALSLLGAAPAALAERVASVYWDPRGITVALRNGLLVYFGDATLPHAKWMALASVLADPSSAGAAYVDVRVPSRPAAGFAEGSAPNLPAAAEGAGEQATSGEASIGSLAAGLSAGSGVSSATPATGAEAGTGTAASGNPEHAEGSEGRAEHSSQGASEGNAEAGSEGAAESARERGSAPAPGG
jgi:cell division protein FtsQ